MTTQLVPITGNTYPVKDQIKALAPEGVIKWDSIRKAWMVPADKAVEAQKLVDNAPASTPRAAAPRRSYYGGRRNTYTRCTHEDYPCCGCER